MKTEATSALEYAVAQLNLYKDALEKEIKGFVPVNLFNTALV